MLLDAGRPAEALTEFEATMKKEPNRFRGIYGAARAAEAAGQRARAVAFYKQLLETPVSQTPVAPSSNTPATVHPVGRPAAGTGLEPPRGWLRTASHLGPGLIISAAIVGSGELIVTPKMGAALGFSMLWFILFADGEGVRADRARAPGDRRARDHTRSARHGSRTAPARVVASWFWLLMYVGLVFQVAGLIGGCVLIFETMNFNLSRDALLVGITASGAVLLVTGRYKVVELGRHVDGRGVYGEHNRRDDRTAVDAVSGVGQVARRAEVSAAGVVHGGVRRVRHHRRRCIRVDLYPYWCLEKGYARHIGPRDDTLDWRRRMLGWLRVLHADAVLSMLIYTGATIAFYILGAAVLHGQGLQVTDCELIETLARCTARRSVRRAPGYFLWEPSRFCIRPSSWRPRRTRACSPTPPRSLD